MLIRRQNKLTSHCFVSVKHTDAKACSIRDKPHDYLLLSGGGGKREAFHSQLWFADSSNHNDQLRFHRNFGVIAHRIRSATLPTKPRQVAKATRCGPALRAKEDAQSPLSRWRSLGETSGSCVRSVDGDCASHLFAGSLLSQMKQKHASLVQERNCRLQPVTPEG